jgi:hypothetical protein
MAASLRRRWASQPTRPPTTSLRKLDAVYGYSFILTNLDVTTPDRAAAVEHWYRHRTQIELTNLLTQTAIERNNPPVSGRV